MLVMDATRWARRVAGNPPQPVLRADDVPLDTIEQLGGAVVEVVGEKRTAWRRWYLTAPWCWCWGCSDQFRL